MEHKGICAGSRIMKGKSSTNEEKGEFVILENTLRIPSAAEFIQFPMKIGKKLLEFFNHLNPGQLFKNDLPPGKKIIIYRSSDVLWSSSTQSPSIESAKTNCNLLAAYTES